MADIDLPLWTIPPNWADGVTERLSWLTDVITGDYGTEQRRALRLSPRREFEFRINPVGRVRSYFDQWLHRVSDEKIMLPLWHDVNRITAQANAGTTAVSFVTEYTEFRDGDLALLYADPFTYEVVTIDTVNDDGLDLVAQLNFTWPKNTLIYPLRRAYMDPQQRLSAMTSRVGQAVVGFQLDGPQDYDTGDEVLMMYDGYPVVTLEPNRRDDLDTEFSRIMGELDNETGVIRRYDQTGRSFQTQFYNWTAVGRQEHHELRQTLYRLAGRQKAFWLPSFNEDVTVVRNLVPAANVIDIEKIGYRALGGAVAGRDYIILQDDEDDYKVLKIINTSNPVQPDEDRLVLSAVSGINVAAGRKGSFLSILRLENDIIEITHHTDTHGVCEVGVAAKTFDNSRVPTAPFILPTPVANKTLAGCGAAPESEWRFRTYWLPNGVNERGPPTLGFWIIPTEQSMAAIDGGWMCVDPEGIQNKVWWHYYDATTTFDGQPFRDQMMSVRIQGNGIAEGQPGCGRVGDGTGRIALWAKGPFFPAYRKGRVNMTPLGNDYPFVWDAGNGEAGVATFGAFPEDAFFDVYADYEDPRWVE